jgi:hypothetical protein
MIIGSKNIGGGIGVLPSYTWATRPSAASVSTRAKIHISDIGPANGQGSEWYSDGTNWRPVGDHLIIGGSASEVSIANVSPNTTINTHRTITLPAGIILPGCFAELNAKWAHTASTNNKYLRLYLGGTSGTLMAQYNSAAAASVVTDTLWTVDFITSANGAGTQLGKATGSFGTGVVSAAHNTGSVNTTAATSLVLASNMGATNETVTLKSFNAMLYYR